MSSFSQDERSRILSWTRDFAINLSETQLHLLHIYLTELLQWNGKFNLMGLSSRHRVITDLLLDSLIPSPMLPKKGRLLDVGSGAGFPGIPLKICNPQIRTHLLEPNSKKVSFLKHVVRKTGLRQIEILRGRIEQGENLLHPHGYHVITARALANLPLMLDWCTPYVVNGGLIVNFQGDNAAGPLHRASQVIEKHRLLIYKSMAYKLPPKKSPRHLLVFRKKG